MQEAKKKGFIYLVIIALVGSILYQSWNIYQFSLSICEAKNIILEIDSSYIKTLNKQNNTQKEPLDSKNIEKWLNENGETLFNVNKKDISTEFLVLKKCWQKALLQNATISCEKYYSNIKKSLQNYIKELEEKIKWAFILIIIFTILLILFLLETVKRYINKTIKENIIYDNESRLYSYYYCMDITKRLCSQSDRSRRAISAIFIQLPQLEKYSIEDRKKILESVGEYITSTIRLSDVACRYGNSSFLILMTNISDKEKIPVSRISEGLTKYVRKFSPNFEIVVSSAVREYEEDHKEFIKRATNS